MRSETIQHEGPAPAHASPSGWGKPCLWLGALIFLLALGLRLAHVVEYTRDIGVDYYRFDQTDNHTFHLWAKRIAGGDWLCKDQIHPYHDWTARIAPEAQWLEWYGGSRIYHQAPLYPYLVGAIYALCGVEPFYVRIFQALLGALTAVAVFLTARAYFGRTTGTVAGLLLAFSGFHLYYDAFILRESLITFLLAFFLLVATWAFKRKSPGLFALAGLLLGLSMAAKPTALLLLPFYTAALLVIPKGTPPCKRILRAVLFAGAFLVPLAPLYLRNAALDVPLLKISTRGPTAFINGNFRGQHGTEWAPPSRETRAVLWNANYKFSQTVAETLKSHEDDPLAYPAVLWEKTRAFFNSYEIPNNTNYYLIRSVSSFLKLGFVSYWFIATAGILGMFLLLPGAGRVWQLYLVALVIALAAIAFFIVARFRQPIVPVFCIFAAYGTVWFFKKLKGRRWAAAVTAAAAFCLVLSWTDHDKLTYNTRMSAYTGVMLKLAAQEDFTRAAQYKDRLIQALREYSNQRYVPILEERVEAMEKAFQSFERSTAFGADDPKRSFHLAEGYFRLMIITKRTQFLEFARLTREAAGNALNLDPDLPGANKILGSCYVRQAERTENIPEKIQLATKALKHFRRELRLVPDDPECLKALGFCLNALGADNEAIRYYSLYLEKSGTWDYEIESRIAWLLMNSSKPPEEETLARALALAEDAYRHDPDNLRFCRNYSTALYLTGRIEEAIRVVERMIPLDPANADEYRGRVRVFTEVMEKNQEEEPDTYLEPPGK